MKETLIVYNLHERNKNTDFFVKHGLQESDDVDYFFVINNLDLTLANYKRGLIDEPFANYEHALDKYQNLRIVNRANVGHDFGAYSFATFFQHDGGEYLRNNYKYFIFLNSTALGPFLPVWFDKKTQHWSSSFTSLLNDKVKLVGPTINIHGWKSAHVQSYFLATDKVGLNIGISSGIFGRSVEEITRQSVIDSKEIGYSRAIIDKGYNISCLLTALKGIDFVEGPESGRPFDTDEPRHGQPLEWNFCSGSSNSYFGIEIHPYEVMFMKTNRGISINAKTTNKFVKWNERI